MKQKRKTAERKARQAAAWTLYRAACKAHGITTPERMSELNSRGKQIVVEFYKKVKSA